jgi:hypothetical protein
MVARNLKWHPQTEMLALCIHRTGTVQHGPRGPHTDHHLPHLPREVWEIILKDFPTNPHPIFGDPAPLLTIRESPATAAGEPKPLPPAHDRHADPGPHLKAHNWHLLPASTQKRWTHLARLGVYLHLMDNKTAIRDHTMHGMHRPMPDWHKLMLLEAGQEAAKLATKHRLRVNHHCLAPIQADAAARAVAMATDDSDAWRFLTMIACDLKHGAIATQARSEDRTVRTRYRKLSSRRLNDDSLLDQVVAGSPSLRPPLGLHVREGLQPPILRYLAAQGLCAPDNQPPATATTPAQIIRHIFA